MEELTSLVCGRRHRHRGPGRALLDAATGEEFARVPLAGVDAAAALAYGRDVGGPALRRLTFAQRGRMLKEIATRLREHRDALRDLAARSGATRADADRDIDLGLQTLRRHAAIGLNGLPDGNVLPCGDGGELAVPRHGVAVHINAFGLPVWSTLDRVAAALLAGTAAVVRPAGSTAHVVAGLVDRAVATGSVPGGALQLALATSDLAAHVRPGDAVSFSGSSATAARIQAALLRRRVRARWETESLNRAVLAPDASPGTPAFDAFADHLITSMTWNAGQTPGALRNAFVPSPVIDDVAQALRARLDGLVVGDPRDPAVDVGPLCDLGRRTRVREAIDRLAAAGRPVTGSPDAARGVRPDAAGGAFVAPTLLQVDDPLRGEPYEVEAYGPVCTLIPYRSPEEVADAVARGGPVRRGVVATADEDAAARLAGVLMPWHDRLEIADGTGTATARGDAGGTGRCADDGERLRSVLGHMARTTLVTTPQVLSSVTGRWHRGARRTRTGGHPLRMHVDELKPGDSVVAGPRRVTRPDIRRFAELTGDAYYLHTDDEAARRNPVFGGVIAHGYLVVSLAAGQFTTPEPGPVLANLGLDGLRFLAPVRPDDEITVTLTAKEITPRGDGRRGEVRWDVEVTNQDGRVVANYDIVTLMAASKSRRR